MQFDLLDNISCHFNQQHKGAKAKDLEAFDQYKGRVAPPKQMNFRKSYKHPLLKKPCLKVQNVQH